MSQALRFMLVVGSVGCLGFVSPVKAEDDLRSQILACYEAPSGSTGEPPVAFRVRIDQDGRVESFDRLAAPKTDQARDIGVAASKAIRDCAPYRVGSNPFQRWTDATIVFDVAPVTSAAATGFGIPSCDELERLPLPAETGEPISISAGRNRFTYLGSWIVDVGDEQIEEVGAAIRACAVAKGGDRFNDYPPERVPEVVDGYVAQLKEYRDHEIREEMAASAEVSSMAELEEIARRVPDTSLPPADGREYAVLSEEDMELIGMIVFDADELDQTDHKEYSTRVQASASTIRDRDRLAREANARLATAAAEAARPQPQADVGELAMLFSAYAIADRCADLGYAFSRNEADSLQEAISFAVDQSHFSQAEKDSVWNMIQQQMTVTSVPRMDLSCAQDKQTLLYAFPNVFLSAPPSVANPF